MNFKTNLDENIKYLEERFTNIDDVVKRKFPVGDGIKVNLYFMYMDVMIDRTLVDEYVDILMIDIRQVDPKGDKLKENVFDALKNGGLATIDIAETKNADDAIEEVLTGNTLLLIDGFETAIIISTKAFPHRPVSRPEVEAVVQGPQEAFTEAFRINTVLIRRRIRDTNLKLEQIRIGTRSRTDIGIMYMEDIVKDSLLTEVKERLSKIDIDAILDSGYIEEFIQDDYKSPFPQVQMTERPDKVASALLEGRVAIVVDNTPFVILVPVILASFYQSSEDYYARFEVMSFIRVLRYIAGFLAIFLPALYIAFTEYHPDMIPMELILKMSQARAEVPIPTVLEILLMDIAFEILKEAGLRLPSAIGNTLGIVGGIIIGQSAVEAGLVSPIVVIVISFTAICSFCIPSISLVAGYRLTKYFAILLASILGFFGFCLSLLICLIHLVSLKSFGLPYLYPFVSTTSDIKDTFVRPPLFMMKKRPIFAKRSQRIRLKTKGDE